MIALRTAASAGSRIVCFTSVLALRKSGCQQSSGTQIFYSSRATASSRTSITLIRHPMGTTTQHPGDFSDGTFASSSPQLRRRPLTRHAQDKAHSFPPYRRGILGLALPFLDHLALLLVLGFSLALLKNLF